MLLWGRPGQETEGDLEQQRILSIRSLCPDFPNLCRRLQCMTCEVFKRKGLKCGAICDVQAYAHLYLGMPTGSRARSTKAQNNKQEELLQNLLSEVPLKGHRAEGATIRTSDPTQRRHGSYTEALMDDIIPT